MFHRAIAANAEAIVVHQQVGGRDILERQRVPPAKIQVIAHGTPHVDGGIARRRARAPVACPTDAKIALFFGVIHPKKNLQTIVAAAGAVAARGAGLSPADRGNGCATARVFDEMYGRKLARAMGPGTAGGLDRFSRRVHRGG